MVSIDSKRRSDAFPISAYQTGRSGNFVDHRRDFDARFLKREEVWRDCTAFLAVLPDFWKWSDKDFLNYYYIDRAMKRG